MRSSLLPFWFVAICCPLVASSVEAQTRREVPLTVRARGDGSTACFEPSSLQTRIAHYAGTRFSAAAELRLDLIVDGPDSAELLVYRSNQFVSRRSFANLPVACADRRDTVALSIALAIEAALAPPSPSGAGAGSGASEPASVDGASERASEGARASESEPAGAAESKPEPPPAAASATPLTAAEPEPTPAAAPAADEAAESQEPADEARSASDTTSPRTGPFVALHVGGRWLVEAVPAPVWTGALGAELWLTHRLALDLSAFASTLGNSTFEGGRAQAWVSGGELLGCAAWKLGSFAAQGCLGAIAAACRASGEHYPDDRPGASLLWAAGSARASLRWPDEDIVSLRLLIQGNLNFVRPELKVDGSEERLHPGWVGAAAGLDVIVSLE